MNHLAHAVLAGDDEGLRLGGVMGDFVRGTPDPHLPASVIAGIRLHRAIDSFTDRHAEVVAARGRLPAPYRRYGGILLDMWFDHLLARDFTRWSGQPLAECSDALRGLLHRHDALLPEPLRRFRAYMDAHDLPAGYADPAMLEVALRGIGSRLSRANPLATALPQLQALEAPLQRHFEAFFPELLAFAGSWNADGAATRGGLE